MNSLQNSAHPLRRDPGAYAAPPPVVGPQYCLPYGIDLTVSKKVLSFSGGDFTITDAAGNLVFRVDGRLLSFREKRFLSNAAGEPLLCAQRAVISLHNRWVVFRGSHCDSAHELFTVKRTTYFQLKTSLQVFLSSNSSQRDPDFMVKGNYFERNCTVFHGVQVIAEVKRKFTVGNILLGRDKFVVTIFPGTDYAFVATLIVIMDEIHREETQEGTSST